MKKKKCKFNKKAYRFCCVLITVSALILFTSCGKEKRDSGSDKKSVESTSSSSGSENHLNDTIGGVSPFLSVLNGKELSDEKTENSSIEIVEGILRGDKGYRKQHKELKNRILEYVKDYSVSRFKKNKKVYLSLQPIYFWDAMKKKVVFKNPKVLFFTKDMEAAGECSLWSDDGRHFESSDIGPLNESVRCALKYKPKVRLIFVANGGKELVIREDNTVLDVISGGMDGDIELQGQYFQKVDKNEVSFSLKTIFESTKLLK